MKEKQVQEWLDSLPAKPTTREVFNKYAPDFESVIMAYVLSDYSLPDELHTYCNGMDLSERLEKYSAYPLWFKTFIRQDVKTAIQIFRLNRDKDKMAKEIILDWDQEIEYLNLVKNAMPFPNNEFNVNFKKVVFHNEESLQNNIEEEFVNRINSGHNLEFNSEYDKGLFYFLELQNLSEFSSGQLREINFYAAKIEDYLISDIKAVGKITDKDVLFSALMEIQLFFQEPRISLDKKTAKKEALDIVTDGLEDIEDALADELAVLIGGRSLAAGKILYKALKYYKKSKNVVENFDITFSTEDEKDFFDRFSHEKNSPLRSFFINDIKIPLQKFYIKHRMDFSALDDSFFEKQYSNFINTRFYSKVGSLTEDQQKEIDQEQDQDKKDLLVFIYVSKMNLNQVSRRKNQMWDFAKSS
jgi:hypothetical protein